MRHNQDGTNRHTDIGPYNWNHSWKTNQDRNSRGVREIKYEHPDITQGPQEEIAEAIIENSNHIVESLTITSQIDIYQTIDLIPKFLLPSQDIARKDDANKEINQGWW